MGIKKRWTLKNIQYGVYDYIDILVKQYQNGSEFAANDLVVIFEPFLMKYVNILKTPSINLANLDTRKFLKLFSKDEEFVGKIVKARRSRETQKKAYYTSSDVHKKVKTLDDDDVYNELVAILLTLALRYNKIKKKVNFCGYVSSVFRYEAYRLVNKVGNDPLTFEDTISIYNTDYIGSSKDIHLDEYDLFDQSINHAKNDDELGVNWLMGLNCSECFENLTYTERYILKLYYGDKLSDEQVATATGVHRNTAREQRISAVNNLKNSIKI